MRLGLFSKDYGEEIEGHKDRMVTEGRVHRDQMCCVLFRSLKAPYVSPYVIVPNKVVS